MENHIQFYIQDELPHKREKLPLNSQPQHSNSSYSLHNSNSRSVSHLNMIKLLNIDIV